MPTYDYACLDNGHVFEARQSFSEPALTACVICGGPVRKKFSAAGIVFKGSGYYVNDTRKPDSSSSDSSSSSSTSSSSETTSSSSSAAD
ncbi:FmdB family zinc ribbon protein [Stomatohabitans albus]|uniref:FmdB family zinc ribbon protein n=1 Tax=Stomatohabitans albus TaxID=3110766 RepID=UPI00300D6EC6